MRWTHDALVVNRHIVEQVIGVDVLQVTRSDQVVITHARDAQQRRLFGARVQHAVEQMGRARSGRGEADAELSGELRISHGRHRRDFLVPDVNIVKLVVTGAQRFHEAVDPVPGQPEDRIDAPFHQAIDEDV
jgi:hypothetical protein